MISEQQVERLIKEAVADVLEAAFNVTGGRGPIIRIAGVDLDERRGNFEMLRAALVQSIKEALINAGALQMRPEDPRQRAVVTDPHLYEGLKEGFDEGREHPEGTQVVGESHTTPEQYEQLQLPGFEDEEKS